MDAGPRGEEGTALGVKNHCMGRRGRVRRGGGCARREWRGELGLRVGRGGGRGRAGEEGGAATDGTGAAAKTARDRTRKTATAKTLECLNDSHTTEATANPSSEYFHE